MPNPPLQMLVSKVTGSETNIAVFGSFWVRATLNIKSYNQIIGGLSMKRWWSGHVSSQKIWAGGLTIFHKNGRWNLSLETTVQIPIINNKYIENWRSRSRTVVRFLSLIFFSIDFLFNICDFSFYFYISLILFFPFYDFSILSYFIFSNFSF